MKDLNKNPNFKFLPMKDLDNTKDFIFSNKNLFTFCSLLAGSWKVQIRICIVQKKAAGFWSAILNADLKYTEKIGYDLD